MVPPLKQPVTESLYASQIPMAKKIKLSEEDNLSRAPQVEKLDFEPRRLLEPEP